MFTPLAAAAVALAVFALLAVWLALEPGRAKRLVTAPATVAKAAAHQPVHFPLALWAYLGASGQGREGISKRSLRTPSKRAWRLRGVFNALRKVGFSAAWAALTKERYARMFAFPISGADGSTDGDVAVLDDLTDGEKKELKEVGEKAEQLRSQLVDRLAEMKGKKGEDKEEVQRREKEIGEQVDTLIGLAAKQKSGEMKDFERNIEEKLAEFGEQMKAFGRRPAGTAKASGPGLVAKEDRYDGDNLFLDMKLAVKGDRDAQDRVAEYREKFESPDRLKAWAAGELEEVDLILPDIQQALPFLRAQAKIVNLFREIRTTAPSVEFPVWKSGLTVGHVKDREKKPESEPTFDLEVARVFTIAGVSDIPNPLLEDFPAARGWVSTELGSATGAQEERDVISGDGVGEPLGLWANEEIPTRALDATEKATLGRRLITSIFRGAQQVRINGFMEPTDVGMNPAVWTDIALAFEDNIGFLYSPGGNSGGTGAPAEQPPARIMGLPVTWSSYVPLDEGAGEDETSVVVGNYMDGIVLRRSPFRIDVDTSVGFKTNETSFRGEERMGFIVVRPKSFVKVEGIKPSPVE